MTTVPGAMVDGHVILVGVGGYKVAVAVHVPGAMVHGKFQFA